MNDQNHVWSVRKARHTENFCLPISERKFLIHDMLNKRNINCDHACVMCDVRDV